MIDIDADDAYRNQVKLNYEFSELGRPDRKRATTMFGYRTFVSSLKNCQDGSWKRKERSATICEAKAGCALYL